MARWPLLTCLPLSLNSGVLQSPARRLDTDLRQSCPRVENTYYAFNFDSKGEIYGKEHVIDIGNSLHQIAGSSCVVWTIKKQYLLRDQEGGVSCAGEALMSIGWLDTQRNRVVGRGASQSEPQRRPALTISGETLLRVRRRRLLGAHTSRYMGLRRSSH